MSSSGMLRSVGWLSTDVSRLPISSIFKGLVSSVQRLDPKAVQPVASRMMYTNTTEINLINCYCFLLIKTSCPKSRRTRLFVCKPLIRPFLLQVSVLLITCPTREEVAARNVLTGKEMARSSSKQ
jgi:hypothetical protein